MKSLDHVVHVGDCLDPVTGLASLADESVDSVICDPPYSREVLGRSVVNRGPGHGGRLHVEKRAIGYDGFGPEDIARTAPQLARIAKRWIVVFCDIESAHLWRFELKSGGAKYIRTGAWVKPNAQPQMSGDRPGVGFEAIVIAHSAGRCRWNGGGMPAVWTAPFPSAGSAERNSAKHPTPKPLAIIEALVRDFTDLGELVCDPFAGSGTTGVACKRLGRGFIGWERDAKYARAAKKRIAETREQFEMFRAEG